MILDTYKRREENEPLIPEQTPFILTTSLDVISDDPGPSFSYGTITLNTTSNQRYFDRPEVLKAYREQQVIQTPEFVNIAENPSVGGRFRPRAGEESAMDTSDAAYEKRHKKYETFEKRLRLREKEKLKHEQYKLKERIEQLRSMDASAFLTLPDDAFPLPPGQSQTDHDSESLNGTHHEGERRRNEMLTVALGLEERYRVLLPPDRSYKKYEKGSVHNSSEPSEQPHTPRPTRRASTSTESVPEEPRKTITLKIPPRFASRPTTYAYSSKQKRLDAAFSAPPARKKILERTVADSISAPPAKRKRFRASPKAPDTVSNPDIAFLDEYSSLTESDDDEDQISEDSGSEIQTRGRAKKKSVTPATSTSVFFYRSPSPVYASADSVVFTDRSNSILVIAARRSASAAVQRKTIRHLNAFGVKVPEMEYRDYQLPRCITEDISLRLHGPDSASEDDMDVDNQM